jgi:hypothetical protein
MFFDNLAVIAASEPRGETLSRFAGVSEHVTLEVSEASRRAAGEVLTPRLVREKDLLF